MHHTGGPFIMEKVLFEQKYIKLRNKWNVVENKEIMQYD
jgi:hypothetical protein